MLLLRIPSLNLELMKRYGNNSGKSGVIAYETGEESIAVQFVTGEIYLYTYASAGKRNVERLKKLAAKGEGLSTFISQVVKGGYEGKVE